MKSNILFCIPLKKGKLDEFKQFVKLTTHEKISDYKAMLLRYDIHATKIWHKIILNETYVFVYHEIGSNFDEKIKHWTDSQHPFDQWFNQKLMSIYAEGAVEGPATQLLDFIVHSSD